MDYAAYVGRLLEDLKQEVSVGLVGDRELQSIFFGGGTPSLVPEEQLARFLAGVRQELVLAADCEITLEANPGTAEAGHFAGYRAAGVNRVSIGAQSFTADLLRKLGRIHSPSEVTAAVEMARKAGFSRINLDLMHGLPGQDLDGAMADLEQAIALDPGHISYYQLTLEPNTPFHHQPPSGMPDDELRYRVQAEAAERLVLAGYRQYEVSAYSRPGERCRHNLNYWHFGDYLGIGAGAHAKISLPDGRILRRWKRRGPNHYLAGGFIQGERWVDRSELALEFMLNALRLVDGFSTGELEQRTGLGLEEIAEPLEQALRKGLLERSDTGYRPSDRGREMLNDLQGLFL